MIQKIISAKPKFELSHFDVVNQNKCAPKNFAVLKNVRILKQYSMICDEHYIPIDFCLNETLHWQPSYLKRSDNVSEEINSRKLSANKLAKRAIKKNGILVKFQSPAFWIRLNKDNFGDASTHDVFRTVVTRECRAVQFSVSDRDT